jgi:hypothetical protein
MTSLQNPFEFATSDAVAEQAAASSSQPQDVAAAPFDSGEPVALSPDEAAALTRSHAPGAAADIPEAGPCGFEFEPTTDGGGPKESPASGQELCGAGDLGIDCIGEIFRGARKLESVPDIFELDPAAITPEDHVLYDVLKAMDDPRLPGLREIPDEYALFQEIEPPPLFLQAVGY